MIPLLICHARQEWPEDTVRLTFLLSGPKDDLAGYIPDFGFELYDLHRFSDDQIKGTIMSRVMLKEMAELAISKETGGYIMTLAEKLRKEGEKRGEKKGENKGYRQAIEVGMAVKFPGDIDTVMAEVNKIDDLEILIEITKTIHTAQDISEILALIK